MSDLRDGRCTCPEVWLGTADRPPCALHELDDPPPGWARRRDGQLVEIARTLPMRRAAVERDSEGMGAARSWYRPW